MQKVTAPSRFWVIRKPDSSGTVVLKLDTQSPSETQFEIPDSCVAYSVADRASLDGLTTDPSVLTDAEKDVLGIL